MTNPQRDTRILWHQFPRRQPCPWGWVGGRTCVDELDMALQVAVDHEHLVAAGVRAGPLPDLLVVLLDVLLQEGPGT